MHSLGLLPFLRSAISFSRIQLLSYTYTYSREQHESFQARLGAIFTANNCRAAKAPLRGSGRHGLPQDSRTRPPGTRRPGGFHGRAEYPERAPLGHLRFCRLAGLRP